MTLSRIIGMQEDNQKKVQLNRFVSLNYWSIVLPIPLCLNCCSFVVSLEVGLCQSSDFVLLQYCVGYSGSFAFPYKIENWLIDTCKITCWNFACDCVEICPLGLKVLLLIYPFPCIITISCHYSCLCHYSFREHLGIAGMSRVDTYRQ